MIKINLVSDISEMISKSKTKKARFKFNFDLTSKLNTQASVVAAEETRSLILRLLVLSGPIFLVFAYDRYDKIRAADTLKNLKVESAAVEANLKGLDSAVKEVERFQDEKRKLDSELQIIKNLSHERLKNVKALDTIQGIIPEKAWLTSLKIDDKKVTFDGFASDDFVVSEFMQGLAGSVYFSDILLESSEEDKRPEGTMKKFKIKCNLENL